MAARTIKKHGSTTLLKYCGEAPPIYLLIFSKTITEKAFHMHLRINARLTKHHDFVVYDSLGFFAESCRVL